jgi:hypothetical protein
MSQAYKAPNGEILIALDEVQAAAFEKAGMVKTDEKTKKPKTEE